MKNIKIWPFVFLTTAFGLVSCGTNSSMPKPAEQNSPSQETVAEDVPQSPKAPRQLKVVTSTSVQPLQETPEEIYLKKIKGITVECISSPKETSKNKAFSEPFVFAAKDSEGNPVNDFALTILCPEEKNQGAEVFQITNMSTNQEGIISFMPPVPPSAFDSSIKVYPTGDISNQKIAELADKNSVSVPYRVKTNLHYAGGNIALVDFNESGKPITNNSVSSSHLLMALMKQGFSRVGNVDLTKEIISGNSQTVYKAAKNLLGSNSKYLIYGTVKYDSPAEKTADGKFSLKLNGEITCMNLLNGDIFSKIQLSVTTVQDKEWSCKLEASKLLAEELAKKIPYAL